MPGVARMMRFSCGDYQGAMAAEASSGAPRRLGSPLVAKGVGWYVGSIVAFASPDAGNRIACSRRSARDDQALGAYSEWFCVPLYRGLSQLEAR